MVLSMVLVLLLIVTLPLSPKANPLLSYNQQNNQPSLHFTKNTDSHLPADSLATESVQNEAKEATTTKDDQNQPKYAINVPLTKPKIQNEPKEATRDHKSPLKPTKNHTTYQKVLSADEKQEADKNLEIPSYPCTTDTQCYPESLKNWSIPQNYVRCDNKTKTCVCNSCFVSVNDSCSIDRCYHYDNQTGECVNEMKSQKSAFLVSLFLSPTGAANLYIGQELLGYSQFLLLVLVFMSCCCVYCTKKCFVNCCQCYEDECNCFDCCEGFWQCCHEKFSWVFIFLCCLFIFLSCLAMLSWWAVDLTGFIENTKLDGHDCPLQNDL